MRVQPADSALTPDPSNTPKTMPHPHGPGALPSLLPAAPQPSGSLWEQRPPLAVTCLAAPA